MLDDLHKAVRQLPEPGIRGVLVRAVLLCLGLFVALIAVAVPLLGMIEATGIGWLNVLLQVAGGLGILVVAWLAFPIVVVGILSIFVDEVADLVEARHYPSLPPANPPGLVAELWTSLRFVLIALGLNILVLPLYLLPGANLLIYLSLNGYLLSREYFEQVARRRMSAEEAARFRRAHRGKVLGNGVLLAFLSMIPVVNFAAPVIGTAIMVHKFEDLRRRATYGFDLAGPHR